MSTPTATTANLSPEERRALLAKLLREKARATVTTHPAGYGQRALWYIHELAPESAAYNVGSALRLRHKVDVSALQGALQTLVDRHEALRTHFATTETGLVQSIAGAEDLSFTHVDAAGWSDRELDERLGAAHRRPFDLQQGPLLRVQLFTRAEDDHLLLISLHHSITDGWSIGLLLQEFNVLYAAGLEGRLLHLPAAGAPYVEFVRRQMEMLAGPEGEQLRAYWIQQLSGELPQLNLPTDHPRPPVQRLRGATVTLDLAPELLRALERLAHAEQTTLFTVLVAAYQLLLHRYTGQDDMIVGTPMAGRMHGDFYGTLGYFVNAVALRTDFSAETDASAEALTLRHLLKRVRRIVIDALAHQEYPFALLVEQLNPPRDPSRSAIFETTINLMRAQQMGVLPERGAPATAPNGLHAEVYPLEQQAGQFDLMLDIIEDGSAPHALFSYNTDLFEEGTIRRMAGHYLALLASIVADPDQAVDAIPLLTPAERELMLVEWNHTEAPYPSDRCVHDLVAGQAARTPEQIAARCGDARMSYGELERRANQLAHHLRMLGVGPGALAGVFMNRSLDMLVALLGVLKAGGAYVPLDPGFPAERLALMLEDSRAPIILTEEALAASAPPTNAHLLRIDSDWAQIAQQPETTPPPLATAADLAYVIFTSGSTGRPKGVQIPHRAVVNFLTSMAHTPGLAPDDLLVAVTTLSFDIAVLELFLPLIVGAQVDIAPRDVAMSGDLLAERLAESGATVMQATPVTWRLLLAAGWRAPAGFKALCGGEALPAALAAELLAQGIELWNMYGPTETTVWSTVQRLASAEAPILIGRPIANTTLYILDRQLQPAPMGVAGELYIGGDGLARGYWERPDLTAERFIRHPFEADPAARLYNTGDLARYLPDGTVEVLGRTDHQVKIRGFRIELGEIETALARHPGVAEAVVVARDDGRGALRLLAYLAAAGESAPQSGELRVHLRNTLPDYMVPAAFVVLDKLPRTPNGKVDRRALPAPEPARRRDESFAAPTSPTEQAVATIWREVLGVERAGVYDNFFDLGGHSLNAIEALAACERALGARLHPGLLRTQTLGQVAASYDELRQAQPAPTPAAPAPVAQLETQPAAPPVTQAAPPEEQERAGLAGRMWGAMRRALKPDDKQG